MNSGEIERVGHGVYIFSEDIPDMMYIAQIMRPKLIYSHETALFLHELTDRDSINYTVTVPTEYGTSNLKKNGFTVYTIKRELHELGTVSMETMFGHIVTTYGLERKICDCIRSRNQMDIAVVTDAIKRYTKLSNKNLNKLMQMAEVFHITKQLRSYLEVLL